MPLHHFWVANVSESRKSGPSQGWILLKQGNLATNNNNQMKTILHPKTSLGMYILYHIYIYANILPFDWTFTLHLRLFSPTSLVNYILHVGVLVGETPNRSFWDFKTPVDIFKLFPPPHPHFSSTRSTWLVSSKETPGRAIALPDKKKVHVTCVHFTSGLNK